MTVVQAFAHLPYVGVDAERTPIAEGELVRLDFEAWRTLDSSFPFADRAYERARPTFFQVDLDYGDEPGSLEDAVETMSALTHRLYTAIMLVTAERVPTPALSVAYHRDAETKAFATTIGPFEREVLLYPGDERLELGGDEVARVASAAAFLTEHDDLLDVPEIAAALATLERTARPEVTPLSGLVLEVGALEALLLPDVTRHLTATFARRVSALLASGEDELRPLHKRARSWYQARSEAVHGGGVERLAAKAGLEPAVFLFEVRRALVSSLGTLLGGLSEQPEGGLARLRDGLESRWDGTG